MGDNSTVNIGVVGAGFARTTQIPGFLACEGARVVAIASGRRENAERVAREFRIPHVEDDWRGVVARADVDLVSIAAPPATHAEASIAALAAGKAVLCEKPTAMNFEEAARMREAAGRAGLFACLDHELRFLPARRAARDMIARGELGRVRHAKVLFRSDSRAAPSRAWDWWSDATQGGGVLGAIGSHAVDALHWLTGALTADVSCNLSTHVREREDPETGGPRRVTSDDEANLLLRFADGETTLGATAAVSLSVVEPGRAEHSVEIFCERGALRVEGESLFRAELGGGGWARVDVPEAPLAEGMRDSEWSRGFTAFAREIVEAIRRDGRAARVPDAATFEDGYRIQQVLDSARAAHESGCRVTVREEG